MKKSQRRYRGGFTLIEILVVLSIIALLAAIFFPAFSRARENARQANCATNLNQIYFAVQQYFQDERAYPDSLVDLLPEGSKFNNGLSPASEGVIDANAVGYLKGGNSLLTCQNDFTDATLPRSSYGALTKDITSSNPPTTDPSRRVWNYWGYSNEGIAIDEGTAVSSSGTTPNLLMDPATPFNSETNSINYSLSNRFAPIDTIITHCVFHRPQTASNLRKPEELFSATSTNSKYARDVVLRLDGSASSLDVSEWKSQNKWQIQKK